MRDNWSKPGLSPQQLEILALLSEGLTPKEVPGRLDVSASTIQKQLSRMCKKLGVAHWRQAVDLYRPPDLFGKLAQAEVLLRDALFDPRTNNTLAQPKLLECLDMLGRARQILKAL